MGVKYRFTPISIMRKNAQKKVKKIVDTSKKSCYYKTPPRREQASGGALEKEQTVTTLGKVPRWKLKKVLTIYDTHAIM